MFLRFLSGFLRRYKRWLPLLGTALMLTWLFWRVSPSSLLRAYQQIDWQLLVPMTAALALFGYAWDCVCLTWLFQEPGKPSLRYRDVLRARGISYLFSVINWGLGQGLLVYVMSRQRGMTVSQAAGRCVAMAYVDLLVLLTFGVIGVSLNPNPALRSIGVTAAAALVGLVVILLTLKGLPERWIAGIRGRRGGGMADVLAWGWGKVAELAAMRSLFFLGGMVYLGCSLSVCGISLNYYVVISVLAVLAMLDGLPISVGGLGSRETAMILLLDPKDPAVVVAFCLIWSVCVLTIRVVIGLASFWHPSSRGLLVGKPAEAV